MDHSRTAQPGRIPLLVIMGPTSVGKTPVSLVLAERLNGEIISADSRQVYRGMDIGTDKPTLEERRGIPHHLLDLVHPDEPFTLAHYVEQCWEAIHAIHARGKLPILAGSAGLYIRAVVEGYALPNAPPIPELRRELSLRIRDEGPLLLYEELRQKDPEGASSLDPHNPRRLIRFYEMMVQTGRLPSEIWKMRDPRAQNLDSLKVCLTRPREKILERIKTRVEEQDKRGLLEEVRTLLARYPKQLKAFQTHSYQEVVPYLEGTCTWEESKALIVRHTFQYARRQITWFRKESRVCWQEAEPFGVWNAIAARLDALWTKSRPRA